MNDKAIFNICPDSEFFGRHKEILRITSMAAATGRPSPSVFLTGKRWAGKTEFLRRTHKALFWEQAAAAPVYYQFRDYSGAEDFAEDYIKSVLKQHTAFLRRDVRLAKLEVSLDKLEKRLDDDGQHDLAGIISRHMEARSCACATSMLRNAFQAPRLVSEAASTPPFMLLDDIDRLAAQPRFREGLLVMKELSEALSSGHFTFVAASPSRSAFDNWAAAGFTEAMELGGLEEEEAVSMAADLCRQYGIDYDAEVLTLAARKLEGNPMHIKNMVWAGYRQGKSLAGIKDFAEIYADELSKGNTAFVLGGAIPFKGITGLLVLNACVGKDAPTSEEDIASAIKRPREEVECAVEELKRAGVVESRLGSLKWAGDNVTRDFVRYTYETRVKGRSAEEVRTWFMRDMLMEGSAVKAEKIRARLKEDVASAIRSFDGQKLPKALFQHRAFAARIKNSGAPAATPSGDEEFKLPHIVGCFGSGSMEAGETGPEMLIAYGFQTSRFDAGDEAVWIAGVKEAPAPVNAGDADNFLRRSQILKNRFRSARLVRWFVGREGFTQEAAKRLEAEGAYTSDSVQLNAMRPALSQASQARGASRPGLEPDKEFEVFLPAAAKAELVAVKAAEEIGTEMGFDEGSIGQIKAALVEACINAFEHRMVRSGKVHLKFVAGGGRLAIYIQNSGAGFDERPASPAMNVQGELPQKRGWGIELMKGLMDEVRFERLSGGMRIILVKYLLKKGEAGDGKAS